MRRKHLHRTTASIAAASAVALGVGLLAGVAPATAVFGEADIEPIESNIAAKFWASATASSGESTAELAVDDDPETAWVADPAPNQSLTLDLGGTYDNVRKVEVVFPDPGAVYQYVVEASSDGDAWDTIADHSDNAEPSQGAVDLFTRPGTQYIRVTITAASPGATVGISELRTFNYLRDDVTLGADLSWADDRNEQAENLGLEYWVDPDDPASAGPELLDVVQDRGVEYIRLRIFNEPRSESSGDLLDPAFQGPERSAEVAKWIKADRGMGLGIDFHYADSWADPSKQPKPRAWAELEFDELTQEVYDYTYDYIAELIEQGTTPDKVAVGNEVVNGFLYGSEASIIGTTNPPYFSDQADIYQSQPGGGLLWTYWGSDDPVEQQLYDEAWDRFTTLSASGIRAVRDVSDDYDADIEVETHVIIDNGRLAKTMEFWDQYLTRVNAQGADPDVLAHSYYPEWHGSPEHYEFNLNTIAAAHPEYKIDIAETSYPASGGGGSPLPNSPFPRTIKGQADAIQRVFQIANDIPDNRGEGVLVWEPANWQTMFNYDAWPVAQPNASIDVFNMSAAEHIVQDRVYTTTLTGRDPSLPPSVRVLTTADGSIDSVPVEWGAMPDGATDAPGEVIVTGSTEFGEVTAVVAVMEQYTAVECDDVITGRYAGPLTVTSGMTCIDEAIVAGPVSVGPGAGLITDAALITGPVSADGAAVVQLCDTEVTGPVNLEGGSSVTVGNPLLDCAPNRVVGPVRVTDTTGWNVIAGNSITGPLTCSGNAPPPVNNGSMNSVLGPKGGQCADL